MNIERIKELAAMKVIWPKDGADIRKALSEYAEILENKDRIEAAHRREVAELRECLKEAFDLICDGCETQNCEQCVRNMKWRKALEGAK